MWLKMNMLVDEYSVVWLVRGLYGFSELQQPFLNRTWPLLEAYAALHLLELDIHEINGYILIYFGHDGRYWRTLTAECNLVSWFSTP
jgi:hypothetical protein